ncbi:MAG TPA: response regulator transcription factor [Syntrophorhabdaceae bacterium]|nr:response regulator transcription factor [Syntrophorhabdaceae bacterium]
MTDIILIVEDHDSVRESLIQWLNRIFPEFEIMGIKTGEEAINIIKNVMPKIVLMDINLPGINGIETTKIIKIMHPSTKVAILSIYEDEAYKNDAFIAGASKYVPKRLMHTDLIPAIKSLLSTNGNT